MAELHSTLSGKPKQLKGGSKQQASFQLVKYSLKKLIKNCKINFICKLLHTYIYAPHAIIKNNNCIVH